MKVVPIFTILPPSFAATASIVTLDLYVEKQAKLLAVTSNLKDSLLI
jgi:hypothetical protein